MNTEKKRWIVLAACCLVNLCLGSVYAWSVFSAALVEHFGQNLGINVTAGDLAIVYTMGTSISPVTMITGGWINDKFGPKKVILVGSLMYGLSLFLSGFATSITYLILTYGVIGGLGVGMAYGSVISTCVKFFPDKRGFVGGLTTAINGLGSVILAPIIAAVVKSSDVTFTFKAVGITFVVLSVSSVFFIESCPNGFLPAGFKPSINVAKNSFKDTAWHEMLKTPIFYVMILLLLCGSFTGMMVISQASSVAQNMIGMTAAAASIAVSFLALFNAAGRVAAGFLSDKFGRINVLFCALLIGIAGLFCLYISSQRNVVLFYVGIAATGLCFGSFMGVYPGFTADQFGPRNNGVNYGIMFVGFSLAGYFGPQLMRKIYATDGSYQNAFLISAIFALAGIVLTIIYRLLNKNRK